MFFSPFYFFRLIWFVPIRIKYAHSAATASIDIYYIAEWSTRQTCRIVWLECICRQNEKKTKQKHSRKFEWGCYPVDGSSIILRSLRRTSHSYDSYLISNQPLSSTSLFTFIETQRQYERLSDNEAQERAAWGQKYIKKMRLDVNGFTWQQQRRWAGKNNDALQVDNVDKLQSRIWVYGRIIWFGKNTSEHSRKQRPAAAGRPSTQATIRIFNGPTRKMFSGTKAMRKMNKKRNERTK